MTGRQALSWAIIELKKAGFLEETARREARELLALLWDRTGLTFILNLNDNLAINVENTFIDYINKRKTGTPLQYLTGSQEFMEAEFKTKPGVLIPRQDTEIIVEEALKRTKSTNASWALDLGTGSGAILGALALQRPLLNGVGIDKNPIAVQLAKENFQRLGLAERLKVLEGSWFEPLADENNQRVKFDLILSNPPYISTAEMTQLPIDVLQEPHLALWGGQDGLDYYRYLIPQAKQYLQPKGWFIVEIGWQQGQTVAELYRQAGYREISIVQDKGKRDRVVAGRRGRDGP